MKKLPTLKVAIVGTGNIGTDLLLKIERSERLEVAQDLAKRGLVCQETR